MVFWLHTFRSECLSRVKAALDIEKDMVHATALVKFSASSVDANSCFYEVAQGKLFLREVRI